VFEATVVGDVQITHNCTAIRAEADSFVDTSRHLTGSGPFGAPQWCRAPITKLNRWRPVALPISRAAAIAAPTAGSSNLLNSSARPLHRAGRARLC